MRATRELSLFTSQEHDPNSFHENALLESQGRQLQAVCLSLSRLQLTWELKENVADVTSAP